MPSLPRLSMSANPTRGACCCDPEQRALSFLKYIARRQGVGRSLKVQRGNNIKNNKIILKKM